MQTKSRAVLLATLLAFAVPACPDVLPGIALYGDFSPYFENARLVAQGTSTVTGKMVDFPPRQVRAHSHYLAFKPAPISSTGCIPPPNGGCGTATASAFGIVNGGIIKEQVRGTNSNSGICVRDACAGAESVLGLSWRDTLKLFGPPGELAYRLRLHLDVPVFKDDDKLSIPSIIVKTQVWDITDPKVDRLVSYVYESWFLSQGKLIIAEKPLDELVGKDGEQFAIENFADTACGAEAARSRAECNIDMRDTDFFSLDPVTRGASYQDASGIDYRTSVQASPEPASGALLGIALVFGALFAAARNAKRTAAARHGN